MENKILDLLIRLDLIEYDSVEEFYPSVRDSDDLDVDIKVMRCASSGIIFLSQTNHIRFETYNNKKDPEHFKAQGKSFPAGNADDDDRRAVEYRKNILGKDWLDFGAGYGWLLERLGPSSASATAIEASSIQREKIKAKGYDAFPSICDLGDRTFDIITLFHVFEHLPEPIALLSELKKYLRKGGTLILEVPHARDFLIDRLNCASFKNFTFWSEHLILHTRDSLEAFMRDAGFTNISINGYQRYPLANHLHWLTQNKPGGHNVWKDIDSPNLHSAYSETLVSIDQTDTIVGIAKT